MPPKTRRRSPHPPRSVHTPTSLPPPRQRCHHTTPAAARLAAPTNSAAVHKFPALVPPTSNPRQRFVGGYPPRQSPLGARYAASEPSYRHEGSSSTSGQ